MLRRGTNYITVEESLNWKESVYIALTANFAKAFNWNGANSMTF